MIQRRILSQLAIVAFVLPIAQLAKAEKRSILDLGSEKNQNSTSKLPDSYWKSRLDPEVYKVTRCSATEAPFTGKYWNNHEPGLYRCSNCGSVLFDSKEKFDSGTGWPSFNQAKENAISTKLDRSYGLVRQEVVCKHCGAHLGHLFDDGPLPSGKRFCINSASLVLEKQRAKP